MKPMTAYEQGFVSKCAEFGVDPAALLKRAGIMRLLSADLRPAVAATRRGISRFGELLLGGNKSLRANHSTATDILRKALDKTYMTSPDAHFAQKGIVEDAYRGLKSLGLSDRVEGSLMGRVANCSVGALQGEAQSALRGAKSLIDDTLRSELRKVLVARLGAAAGVGGAAYGVGKAISGGEKKAAEASTAKA